MLEIKAGARAVIIVFRSCHHGLFLNNQVQKYFSKPVKVDAVEQDPCGFFSRDIEIAELQIIFHGPPVRRQTGAPTAKVHSDSGPPVVRQNTACRSLITSKKAMTRQNFMLWISTFEESFNTGTYLWWYVARKSTIAVASDKAQDEFVKSINAWTRNEFRTIKDFVHSGFSPGFFSSGSSW